MTLSEAARHIWVRYEAGDEDQSTPLRLPGWAFYCGSRSDLHGVVLVESLCDCQGCQRAGAPTYQLVVPRSEGELELRHVRRRSLRRLVSRPTVWFDALAHTVTVDGGWPRCVECGEEGSHEDCQPEALRELEAVAR